MHPRQLRKLIFLGVLVALGLWAITTAAGFVIDYSWWKEVGQVSTWFSMLWFSIAPVGVCVVVAFIALWIAHGKGLEFAGIRRREFPLYSRLIPVALAIVALFIATASTDYWTVMRFFGSRGIAPTPGAWIDPVFSRPLSFYLFDLPFYSQHWGSCLR
jgi:uncharacterized membrane protein (UPF0182 family)